MTAFSNMRRFAWLSTEQEVEGEDYDDVPVTNKADDESHADVVWIDPLSETWGKKLFWVFSSK